MRNAGHFPALGGRKTNWMHRSAADVSFYHENGITQTALYSVAFCEVVAEGLHSERVLANQDPFSDSNSPARPLLAAG
jgi:hypothetical protein